MPQKILVTGGAGFIGSEFLRQRALHNLSKIVVIDKLSYAGDLKRLSSIKKQIKFYKEDISQVKALENIFKAERPKCIIHFAAESHVDRSLFNIHPFIDVNMIGTHNLIKLSLKYKIQ